MYFLGSDNRTRGHYENMQSSILYFRTDLDPDGCLVADQLTVYAKHLKYRVQRNQRGYFRAGWWPCKKLYYFCDGLVFFIDKDLLMGALIESLKVLENFRISERNVQIITMIG